MTTGHADSENGTRPRFRVLGSLAVISAGHEVPVSGNKLRVVLAGLLLRAGENVPVGRLAAWLWEDEADDPDRARSAVHTYVNRLRRRPEIRDVIRTVPDGYRAEVDASTLDLLRFRGLTRSARHAAATGDLDSASRVYAQALELWRDPVLPNVESTSLHRDEVAPMTEEWLHVQEQALDVGLRTGGHAELVPRLRELTRARPLREPFWERLMLALYRSGRPAEALQAYHALSDLLAEELGVDPGASLRAIHQAILTGDPSLGPTTGAQVTARVATARGEVSGQIPRQLRPDIAGFAGRRAELRALDRLLDGAAPVIVSVQGAAGSGQDGAGDPLGTPGARPVP